MALGVTPRANELLEFIVGYMDQHHGIAPTLGEMCVALNAKSKSKPHVLLRQLEMRGRIRRLPNRARAIEVLDGPAKPTARQLVPILDMTDPAKYEHLVWDDGEKWLVPLASDRNRG